MPEVVPEAAWKGATVVLNDAPGFVVILCTDCNFTLKGSSSTHLGFRLPNSLSNRSLGLLVTSIWSGNEPKNLWLLSCSVSEGKLNESKCSLNCLSILLLIKQ